MERSKPLGGKVDSMLEHRLPEHARPAYQRNRAALVPTKLAAKLAPILTQLGMPANRIRSVDNLDSIVCVDELLGLPAHAFPFLRLVGGLVPEDRDAKAATTIAGGVVSGTAVPNHAVVSGWGWSRGGGRFWVAAIRG